ncbi:MAG: hypothetical protein V3S71_03165 [Acidobacteriota bacterium]
MNGRVAKRLRKALLDKMVAMGTVEPSSYRIETVRQSNGEQAQMLVGTGFRKLYREMKRDYKRARRGT